MIRLAPQPGSGDAVSKKMDAEDDAAAPPERCKFVA